MEPQYLSIIAMIGLQTVIFAFWLGSLSQRVKALEKAQEQEPTLHQIHVQLQHLTTLMEAANIKPATRPR